MSETPKELAEKVREFRNDHGPKSLVDFLIAMRRTGDPTWNSTDLMLGAFADRIEALDAPANDDPVHAASVLASCRSISPGDVLTRIDYGDKETADFCMRLVNLAKAERPVDLWGCEYLPATRAMALPLDADGVPIRIGDVMYWPLNGETDEVAGIGDGVFFYTENGRAEWMQTACVRHHKPRTLNDIRLDMADAISGKDSDRIDVLIHEAYELGMKAAEAS